MKFCKNVYEYHGIAGFYMHILKITYHWCYQHRSHANFSARWITVVPFSVGYKTKIM